MALPYYDFEPNMQSESGLAEVFETHNGETLFWCRLDSDAMFLTAILSGIDSFSPRMPQNWEI